MESRIQRTISTPEGIIGIGYELDFVEWMVASLLHTQPSTVFRGHNPDQLQPILYFSTRNRQTVAILGFLCQVWPHCVIPCIMLRYLERSRPLQPLINIPECGMMRAKSHQILILKNPPC